MDSPEVDSNPKQDSIFVAVVALLALLVGTSMCAPLVVGMYLGGDFTVTCSSDMQDFEEFWDDHTTPKRMFSIFMCIEMILTRGVAARELFDVLQLFALNTTGQKSYNVSLFYMWANTVTTALLDALVLSWAFLNGTTCDDILDASKAHLTEVRKMHTLHPLCIQSSNIADIALYLHLFNSALVVVIAGLVTAMCSYAKHTQKRNYD